jgi:ketosteroid isomerase-like protein
MKIALLAAVMALGTAVPAASAHAQSMDHSAHVMTAADTSATLDDKTSGAESVLAAYRAALTARDTEAMASLFAEDSAIFESGKAEGKFSNYLERHLGPELAEFASFSIGEPKVAVTTMDDMAFASETYTYRIELADGRVVDRDCVATSVLMHDAGGWKIFQYHSSSRAPGKMKRALTLSRALGASAIKT